MSLASTAAVTPTLDDLARSPLFAKLPLMVRVLVAGRLDGADLSAVGAEHDEVCAAARQSCTQLLCDEAPEVLSAGDLDLNELVDTFITVANRSR